MLEFKLCKDKTCIGFGFDELEGFIPVCIELNERFRHVAIFGSTGTGKTTLLSNMMLQDFCNNFGFCFIDPKGDAVNELLSRGLKLKVEDLILIDPLSSVDFSINFLKIPDHVKNREAFKEVVVCTFVELLKHQTKFWGERFGRLFEALVRGILDYNEQLKENKQLDILDLYLILLKKDKLIKFAEQLRDPLLKEYIIESLRIKGEDLSREAILRRLNDWIHNKIVRAMFCKNKKENLNFEEIIESGKIILVKIPKGELGNSATQLFGTIFISLIWANVKSKGIKITGANNPYFLYIDEFHSFAFNKGFFDELLSESRAFNLGTTIATQYPSQLPVEIRNAVYSNCSTLIVFNVQNPYDAEQLSLRIPDITASDILNLGKFEAYVRLHVDCRPETIKIRTYPPFCINSRKIVTFCLSDKGKRIFQKY